MGNFKTTEDIQVSIAKGTFNPHNYLTNLSMAYYQQEGLYVHKSLSPIVPVQLSTAYYYEFPVEDLARDNVARKPQFGKVNPAIVGTKENTYSCKVDQVIRGIDQIQQVNYSRTRTPFSVDPRKSMAKFIAEQMNIHQDISFADAFFQSGVWTNEWTGGTTDDSSTKAFIKFSDANCDPINYFDFLKTEMARTGRRVPNVLALGINAWIALKNNPAILGRINGGATASNPAIVTQQLVAQMLGLKKIVVFQSTYNAAGFGETADMRFICDPNAALLCYVTDTPAIDEPSAIYTFAWDMLGNGNYLPTMQWEEGQGVHAEFMEGLMAYDMKKTADVLGVFMKNCA